MAESKTIKIPLIGVSATGRSSDLNSHRAINLMPLVDRTGAKDKWAWIGAPGLKNFCTTAGVVRGQFVWEDWTYFVAGTTLYRVQTTGGTPETLATGIASSTNSVRFSNNITHLAFVQGTANIYVWDGTTLTDVVDYSDEVAITAIQNDSGTTYTVDSTGHGAENGDKVVIKGTVNFNREYTVANKTANDYDITHINDSDADETGLTDAAGFYRYASGDFPITPTHIVYMDTYLIINTTTADTDNGIELNSGLVSYSDDGRIWESANSFAAQRFPDAMTALYTYQGDLFLICEKSMETYQNIGEGDQPFSPSRSAALMWGALGPETVAQVGNGFCLLSRRENGQITVIYQEGYSITPVASDALDYHLSQATEAQLKAATAFSYREEGSDFYVLTFGNQTWVYDQTTSKHTGTPDWHERQDNAGDKARYKYYSYLAGKHLVSDHTESKILEMDRDTYTELVGSVAQGITRTGVSGIIHSNDKRLFHSELYLDMENPVGTGTIELFSSDDGGHTYTSHGTQSFTGRGTRPEWHRLGMAKTDRIYKIVTSAALAININAAYVTVEPGLF